MNARMHTACRRPAQALAVLFLAGVLAGCASSKNKIDWDARVGSYTYDQAVLEMGPPDKEAKLTDDTIVAQWLTRRGYSYRTYHLLYGGWIHANDMPPGPDQFLTLTFSPERVLKEWRTVYR